MCNSLFNGGFAEHQLGGHGHLVKMLITFEQHGIFGSDWHTYLF